MIDLTSFASFFQPQSQVPDMHKHIYTSEQEVRGEPRPRAKLRQAFGQKWPKQCNPPSGGVSLHFRCKSNLKDLAATRWFTSSLQYWLTIIAVSIGSSLFKTRTWRFTKSLAAANHRKFRFENHILSCWRVNYRYICFAFLVFKCCNYKWLIPRILAALTPFLLNILN